MIHIVQDWNANHHADHLQQMFRLRAREFGTRRGWDVTCVDGQERDHFDDHSPVYVLATNSSDEVVGSCRLLPSTGPTLLQACFSDTMPDAVNLVDATIWECTRFCVDGSVADGGIGELGEVTRSIVHAVCELALRAGIETLLANIDGATLRMCRKAGYVVDVLGMTSRYGSRAYLGAFPVRHAAAVAGAAHPAAPVLQEVDTGAERSMLV